MANYTNIPNQLFDDLADGKINSKMFVVLVWLLRRANYSTGGVIKVSAPRIRAEMWGDDLEAAIPSERTIQEILKRLDRSGYITNHHIDGRRGTYAVTVNNYSASIKGPDGAPTSVVLNEVNTTCWRDLPEFDCSEKKDAGCGDPAVTAPVTVRGDCGDPSAYTSVSPASSNSPASPALALELSDYPSRSRTSQEPISSDAWMGQDVSLAPVSAPAPVPELEPTPISAMAKAAVSVQASTAAKAKAPVSVPASIPDNTPDPDFNPKECGDVVYLCSLWLATQGFPREVIETSPVPKPHPWGHPRTWTPAQRREEFLKWHWHDNNPNSLEPVLEPDQEPEPEPETNPAKQEDALLRDEELMLEIYLKHGREEIEEVLTWLPTSRYWHDKISSLADFTNKFDWVSNDCEKYYQKALDNGTAVKCDDYVYGKFLAAGGDAVDSIFFERLNPLPPIDPADAAEEEAMYAFDDEFGVGVFNPWAEQDLEDAIAARNANESSSGLFNVWAELDGCDDAIDAESVEECGEPDICDDPMEMPTPLPATKPVVSVSQQVATGFAPVVPPSIPVVIKELAKPPRYIFCKACGKQVDFPHVPCLTQLKKEAAALEDKKKTAYFCNTCETVVQAPHSCEVALKKVADAAGKKAQEQADYAALEASWRIISPR
jgi:hypothetical protein